MSDVAVRILHTRYDHLSHLSKPMPPCPSRSFTSVVVGDQEPVDTPAAAPGAVGEGEGDGEGGASALPGEETEVMSLKSEGRKVRLYGNE